MGGGPGSTGGGQDGEVWGVAARDWCPDSSAMLFMKYFIDEFENEYFLSITF